MDVTPSWLAGSMVVDVQVGSGSDDDPGGGCAALAVLLREKAAMDARVAREVAAFDASGAWKASGAMTARAWMLQSCHLSAAEAARLLSRGRALRHLPAVDRAFAAGALTGDHVAIVVSLDHGATREALQRDQHQLVDLARLHTFAEWKGLLEAWKQRVDPDGTTEAAEEKRNRRDAWLVETFDGTWLGRMTLDPVSGTIVADELERLEQRLFDADRAEAAGRLGRAPQPTELIRTPAQRRADALVWMARRSASRSGGTAKPVPLFAVHMGWETLHGALSRMEDGTPVPPVELLSWLEGADVVRVEHHPEGPLTLSHAMRMPEVTVRCLEHAVLDAKDRKECNPDDRVFTGATRRAIEIRDGRCTHPFCDRPARHCQVDHIIPYSLGGRTTQDNGRLLCSFHNRWSYRHEQRFGLGRQDTDEPPPPRRE
jgi:5-methylcytosine-specific restriction endonuclease McrA